MFDYISDETTGESEIYEEIHEEKQMQKIFENHLQCSCHNDETTNCGFSSEWSNNAYPSSLE